MALPHPAVELGRLRLQDGGGAGEFHRLQSRREKVVVVAELELGLDLVDLGGSKVSEPGGLIRAQKSMVGNLGI